jgi:hypothetical protein
MSRCDHKPRDAEAEASASFPSAKALTPLEWQALLLASKDAGNFRKALEVGADQCVAFDLHVDGLVTVSADQLAHVKKGPSVQAVLAVVLEQLGPKTRHKIAATVAERFGPGNAKDYEPSAAAVELVEQVLFAVQTRVPQPRSGNVTGVVRVVRKPAKA